ncbi:MAG TPA: MFS transporter [Acidimicrobiales bacterium]|nr:MFS transporter [Acidimicrobiales bacterium]
MPPFEVMRGPAEPPATDTPAEAADGRGDLGQLAVVTFSHAIQHVYVAGLAVAYPFVIASLHVSYSALGIVLGVAGVVGGLLQALAGFVNRASSRMLLSVQNFGMAAASLLGAVGGFALFGAARSIGSVVSWPQHPVGGAVLTRRFPTRRAYALSWHVAGGSIGTAVIPLVVSALIAASGWRVGVAFLAVPMAIGGVLVAWKLRDEGGDRTDVAAEDAARLGHLDVVRSIMRSREALGAAVAGTIAAGGRGLGTLAVFVPAYLKSGLHLQALTVGGLFTALVVGSIVGPVLAGHVADRLGRRRVLLVVYMVGAGTIAAFVMVGRDLFALGAVGVLVGIFAYAESPLLQAVFADGLREVDHQGAFGYYFALSYGIGSLWTIALGVLIDTAGFRWAFYVMAMSFAAAALVVWWARPERIGTPGLLARGDSADGHAEDATHDTRT